MSNKVTVIWNVPGNDGCIFRAPRPTAAFDSAHHIPPEDLDLRPGANEGISRAAVDYWRRRTRGLTFKRKGDIVTIALDGAQETTRRKIATPRDALARELRAFDRKQRARRR